MKEYLGTSLKYPIVLKNGSPVYVSGVENIKQSIGTILSTSDGARFFLPEYGSRTQELLFEQNDDVLENMMRLFIKEALDVWETRIEFKDVTFEQKEDAIYCYISYKILMSNELDSYVYPFYREIKY